MQRTLDATAAHVQVEMMLRDRTPFHEIESWIDRQPISAQRRDALWLVAWFEKQRPRDQLYLRSGPQG